MIRFWIAYLFLTISDIPIVIGQSYAAPSLYCVQRQSPTVNVITFRPPVVTCGSFVAFHLYRSTALNIPFVKVATITDPTINSYTDAGLSNTQAYYYYMTSEYNCPGFSALHSDTFLDSRPSAPKITHVSIENQKAKVYWQYQPSKKIQGYRIDWIGQYQIGRVNDRLATSFVDTQVKVDQEVRLYGVNAMDSCSYSDLNSFGVSGANFPHSPILLSKVEDKCEGTITLNWSPYLGWGDAQNRELVKEYQIQVKRNERPYVNIAVHQYDNRSYIYNGFEYGDSLCIRIAAIHPTDQSIVSYSNEYCFVAELYQAPKVLQVISTQYLEPNVVKTQWYSDSTAIFKNFILKLYDNQSKALYREIPINFPDKIESGYYSYTDSSVSSDKQYTHQIIFNNFCNQEIEGKSANTLYLKTEQVGLFRNKLTWERPMIPKEYPTTIDRYEIWISRDQGDYELLTTLGASELEYIHELNSDTGYRGLFCYQIRAFYRFDEGLPFSNKPLESWSNYSCITQRTVAHIPNAFKPFGINPQFKPMLVFFEGSYYRLQIYDRWGVKIYESNDVNIGWNGRLNSGQIAPEDGYIYLIEYKSNDGQIIKRSGNVILIY